MALVLFALITPVSATTTTGATVTTGFPGTTVEEGVTTTVEGVVATTGGGETTSTGPAIVPAVSTEVTEAPEAQPDWTYRYFIPTLLVLAALVVIATVVRYFTGVVRKRYRVVR